MKHRITDFGFDGARAADIEAINSGEPAEPIQVEGADLELNSRELIAEDFRRLCDASVAMLVAESTDEAAVSDE